MSKDSFAARLHCKMFKNQMSDFLDDKEQVKQNLKD